MIQFQSGASPVSSTGPLANRTRFVPLHNENRLIQLMIANQLAHWRSAERNQSVSRTNQPEYIRDPDLKQDFLDVERSWIQLAHS
jgi:hypothetical protein